MAGRYWCTTSVTPLAGVWIETRETLGGNYVNWVTPLAGVWIETWVSTFSIIVAYVTPLAGVWIETPLYPLGSSSDRSLPLRECGLKPQVFAVIRDG